LKRLAALPFSHRVTSEEGALALVVHANPLNLDDQLYPTLSEEELKPYLDATDAPLLAFGHLHIPYIRPVRGILLVDVSSVGHPKDRDRRAVYTVLEWQGEQRSVTQVRIPYDIEHTVEALRRSDMPHGAEEADALLQASY
jgi:predicted phosphodiesterase